MILVRKLFLFAILLLVCLSIGYSQSLQTTYGTIQVPENRSSKNSRTISINYAVVPAREPSDNPPIIFLQGGPGGSSLQLVPFFETTNLREDRDVILFDARGTVQSGGLCNDIGAKLIRVLAADLTIEEEFDRILTVCNECKQELKDNGVDLAGYNSLANAADIEALRKHLEIDRWILFGGSYGTRLALTYLREYDAAEAAILMGLFPVEVEMYEGFIPGFASALSSLFDACTSDETCRGKYPNLKMDFDRMMQMLEKAPMTVTYSGEEFTINRQDVLLFIHQMMYQRGNIQQVPAFINAILESKKAIVSRGIQRTEQTLQAINLATYWSVQASEEAQFNRKNAFASSLSDYQYLEPGPAFFRNDQRILEEWHSFRSDKIESQPVKSEKPMLIVNGTFDPITPVTNARNAVDYLKNGYLVEFPLDGHVTFNPCFFELVQEFIGSGYQVPTSSCASKGSLEWE